MTTDTATPVTDKIVHSSPVFQTKNYKKFKSLPGNRKVDPGHVAYLKRKIESEGNLTQYFPITVNEKLEVIDGQHRLEALKILGYPVFYEIKSGLNINSVVSLNTGQKNWNWLDFAKSYADRGNVHYKQFIKLAEETGETRFSILAYYATLGQYAGKGRPGRDHFNTGSFQMMDFTFSLKLLSQFQELSTVAGNNMREFAQAALRFMRTPSYNHEQMVDKIAAYGETLNMCYTVGQFLDALEDIRRGL